MPASEFLVPMDLVCNLETPHFAAHTEAVHVQTFDLGSVVRVHPDTAPGVRPVPGLDISRAIPNIVAFDMNTRYYLVMVIDGYFRRARAVREFQLEMPCREGLVTLHSAPSTFSRTTLGRGTTDAPEASKQAATGELCAQADLPYLRAHFQRKQEKTNADTAAARAHRGKH
jgi:hypothetical protein